MTILDELKAGLLTSSAEETESLGERLAESLPSDSILALAGDLGTGKTTLVRGLARGLGIKGNITSPTYTIYSIYEGKRQLVHMDAYRLGGTEDLEPLMLEEFLHSPFLIALEWPGNVPDFLPELPRCTLSLEILSDGRHRLRV